MDGDLGGSGEIVGSAVLVFDVRGVRSGASFTMTFQEEGTPLQDEDDLEKMTFLGRLVSCVEIAGEIRGSGFAGDTATLTRQSRCRTR